MHPQLAVMLLSGVHYHLQTISITGANHATLISTYVWTDSVW